MVRLHARVAGVATGVLGMAFAAAMPALAETTVEDYAEPVAGSGYETEALFSVDDRVPETSTQGWYYRMVGIPDGLGAHGNPDGTKTLYMNHEFNNTVESSPVVDSAGAPVAGEEYRGAFVSRWTLDADGDPISGERAFDTVFTENTLNGPAPEVDNSTPGIARLCSGFLAGPAQGLDRWIYFAGEESSGAGTFDGKGDQSFAFYNNEAHVLPEQGRFAKENVVVQSNRDARTVIFPMEDGPSTPDSQLWMYVGKKDQRSRAGVLERNGLVNGDLYVFRSKDPARNSELGFQSGSVTGEWIRIPGAEDMTDIELEAAADSVGAMTFIRPEDATFNRSDRNELLFVTTGGNEAEGNMLGRL